MGKLGFDLRPLQSGFKAHKERGIGVYTQSLYDKRPLAPGRLEIIGFHDPYYGPGETGSTPFAMGPVGRLLRPRLKEYVNQHLLMRHVMNVNLKKAGVERIFFPTHLDAPSGLNVPYAVTAHDMIQSALKNEYYNTIKHRLHIAKQIEVLRGASLVIAVSKYTKEDVVKYAHVDRDKIVVIHNGVDDDFRPGTENAASRFTLPEKFVLNVGGIDWRKNMELLFNSFEALLDHDPDYHLVITGNIERDPQYQRFLKMLKARSLETRAIALGYVSRQELISLYNRAKVFMYPSLYEGFGFPVLEAMACGAPVITTNRSSIPEVVGGAALTLDPDDPKAFSTALIELAQSESRRMEMGQAGVERARKFSWEKSARETWEALNSF